MQHAYPARLQPHIDSTEALLERAQDAIHRSTLLLAQAQEQLLRAHEHLQSNLQH